MRKGIDAKHRIWGNIFIIASSLRKSIIVKNIIAPITPNGVTSCDIISVNVKHRLRESS